MTRFWQNPFVFGTHKDDKLVGTAFNNFIFGRGGDDDIRPGAGHDVVFAGRGRDIIDGSLGDDYIDGGRGFDTVTYDLGINDYEFDISRFGWGGTKSVVVTSIDAGAPDAGRDVLKRVEALYFAGDDYTLFLNGRNNAVLAGDDAIATDEDATPLVIDAASLLLNDQEFDGDTITVTGVSALSALGAAITLTGTQISYDPGSLFQSLSLGDAPVEDTFTYTVDDGKGGTDIATVTLTIAPRNDAPTLTAPVAVLVDENTTFVTAEIQALDVDAADTLTFSITGGADAGAFVIDAGTGALSFAVAPDFEAPADAGGDNVYDVQIGVSDGSVTVTQDITVTVADVAELEARINEFHYDNAGGDIGEFIEVRVGAGQDASSVTVVLYNGSNGSVYNSLSLSTSPDSTLNGFDYYLISLPPNGLQNGAPDGIALVNGAEVIEFVSYEGTLTAVDGPAAGMTSLDIGVAESGSTPVGASLARAEDGDVWAVAEDDTPGTNNDAAPPPPPAPMAQLVISEVMQNPAAVADSAGEYFEIYNAGSQAVDINGYTVSDLGVDSFVIDAGGSLMIASGGYLVLGNNGDIATNGGVPVDYEYSGMFLSNGADELVITDTLGREVDAIAWDGGPLWPDPNGAAMELTNLSADNSDGANWAEATAAFGLGDLGTPGARNSTDVAPTGPLLNETFDYAEDGQGPRFALSDSSGAAISFFAEDSSFDYFGIFDGDGDGGADFGATPAPSGFNAYTNADDNYLGGSDIDGGSPAILEPAILTWSGIDITGQSTLQISADLATDDSDTALDPTDFILFEVNVDNTGWMPILAFETADDSTFNQTTFLQDTDFDGVGDGPALSAAFATFSDTFTVAGSSMDVRVQLRVDAGREDFGLDNIVIDAASDPVPVINEVVQSTTGTDWEFVELFGAAGTDLTGQSLVQVDGTGTILTVIDLSGASIGADGYFLAASDAAVAEFGLTPTQVDLSIANNTFSNTTSTYLLLDSLTALVGDDLDADDDGVLETSGFGSVIDGVALIEGDAAGVFGYSSNAVIDPQFPPAGAQRLESGTGAFEITAFSSSANYTPGAENTQDPAALERFIWEVQGAGGESPLLGQGVIVEGIVTYTVSNGFFIQEEAADSDMDAGTSDGVFVFTNTAPTVSVGDQTRVTGAVVEQFGETQITADAVDVVSSGNVLVSPVALPLSSATTDTQLEALEGMYFTLTSGTTDALTVITNFNFDRFGEIVVSAGVQTQPTQLFDAQTQAADVQQLIADNAANQLIIDDGVSSQNPTEFAYVPNTSPGDNGNGILDAGDDFSQGGTLRLGTELEDVTGVMRFGFGEYRMLVEGTLDVRDTNPRPDSPASEYTGNLQIAAVNVLNYFTTFTGSTLGGVGVRGADNQDELDRQTDKLIAAFTGMEAEVFALQEIENGGFAEGSAIATLTNELNDSVAGADPYAFVNPTGVTAPGDTGGLIGTDAITTAILYDTRAVTLVASDFVVFAEPSIAATVAAADALAAAIGTSNGISDQQYNRPMVVATFEDVASGEVFSVASVHFKSKGPSGLDTLLEAGEAFVAANPGDAAAASALAAFRADPNVDQGDGQGFWNAVRTDAAAEAYSFITTTYDVLGDGSQFGTQNYVITGDYNAYAQEDPTQALSDPADTVNLLDKYIGPDAYSFVFDGQRGALDQAVASTGFDGNVQDVFEWHINADEPDLLGYDTGFNDPGFFAPDAFASSDHDPLIIDVLFDGTNPDDLLI